MLSYDECKKIILMKYPACRVDSYWKTDNEYVFSLCDKSLQRGTPVFSGDIFPSVNFFTGDIGSFDISKRIDQYMLMAWPNVDVSAVRSKLKGGI